MTQTIATPSTTTHQNAKASSSKSVKPREWNVAASPAVANSKNQIRSVVASLDPSTSLCTKSFINLGLGDPCAQKLHSPSAVAIAAIQESVLGGEANGYVNGAGELAALEAVAEYHRRWDGVPYEAKDITLTHGASHALDIAFSVLTSPSQNVLLPRPHFPQYATLLGQIGCEIRYYGCLGDKGWECDLEEMESLVDENTAWVLVNNPGNPTSVNYSASHIRAIVDLCERVRLPIIADEIYGHMTWSTPSDEGLAPDDRKDVFIPFASLSTSVPIITIAGLSKRFLVPGWRFGWIALHDPLSLALPIRAGFNTFANRIMGPPTFLQRALPGILSTEKAWFDEVLAKLAKNADLTTRRIAEIKGLSCTAPNSAMYCLVSIDISLFPEFESDVQFCATLVKEQKVFCIPGQAFGLANTVRLVTACPYVVMEDALERIQEFCEGHAKA